MKRIFLLLFLENSEKLESDFDFSDLIKNRLLYWNPTLLGLVLELTEIPWNSS